MRNKDIHAIGPGTSMQAEPDTEIIPLSSTPV